MTYLNVLTFFFLASLVSCNSGAQVYNDLNDSGYTGNINSITIKVYYKIGEGPTHWEVKDTAATSTTLIRFFNEDGNFTKKTEILSGVTHQYMYDYSGKTKIGWTRADIHGRVTRTGKFTYNGKISFTETEYDTSGVKKFESIYTLDERQRTKTMEDISYAYRSNKGGTETRINFHTFTTYHDSKDGHLDKIIVEDKLLKQTDHYEYEIIEKDKFNNPISVLVKKNGVPREIRKSTIEYK